MDLNRFFYNLRGLFPLLCCNFPPLPLLPAAETQRTQRCAGFSFGVKNTQKGKVSSKLAVTEALFE